MAQQRVDSRSMHAGGLGGSLLGQADSFALQVCSLLLPGVQDPSNQCLLHAYAVAHHDELPRQSALSDCQCSGTWSAQCITNAADGVVLQVLPQQSSLQGSNVDHPSWLTSHWPTVGCSATWASTPAPLDLTCSLCNMCWWFYPIVGRGLACMT
jgi:hypothetical protein